MSPVFGHGHLRLYLLSLLAEHPRHGYELIQALSERFGGTYSPSAGTIYPRLAKLEEEGLVSKTSDGRKSVYAITVAGRAELAARESELNSIEDQVTDSVRMLADGVRFGVNEAMKSLRAELASAARDARGKRSDWQVSSVFHEQSTSGKQQKSYSKTGLSTAEQNRQSTVQALREAEIALANFRQHVRTDLRKQAAKGFVSKVVIERFIEQLGRVRAELKASLEKS